MRKDQILPILIDRFRAHGYDGLSLATISKATGLGKASLYHHFPKGKEQMAREVLVTAQNWITQELVQVMKSDLSPDVRLETTIKKLDQFYASGRKACLLDVMVTENSSSSIVDLVAASFGSLTEGFQKLAQDFGHTRARAKILSEEAVVRIQGSLVVSMGTRDPKVFRSQMNILKEHFKNIHTTCFSSK
jgi:AcrR family transcriptional regulator